MQPLFKKTILKQALFPSVFQVRSAKKVRGKKATQTLWGEVCLAPLCLIFFFTSCLMNKGKGTAQSVQISTTMPATFWSLLLPNL